MKELILSVVIAASLASISGCAFLSGSGSLQEGQSIKESSAIGDGKNPDPKVPENIETVTPRVDSADQPGSESKLQKALFHHLTEMKWVTWEDRTGGSETINPSWVSEIVANVLAETNHSQAQVILDGEGQVQSLYGQEGDGLYFQWVRGSDGEYARIEPKGFVTETTIKLKVGYRMGMEKLGLTQRLAVKRFVWDMQGQPLADKLDQYLEEGIIELTFKGLFMNRKLVGPTEILEAKGQLYGQELNFLSD